MPVSAQNTYTNLRYGVSPETLSVISARNRMYAVPAWAGTTSTPVQVGVVASFNPSEGRTIEPVRGIGYGDRVMELVPGMTDPMTMTVTRTAQYLSLIMQVFGYKGGVDGICRSLRHHKYPFDIRQELIIGALAIDADNGSVTAPNSSAWVVAPTGGDQSVFPDGSTQALSALLTLFEACWMADWSVTYASDTALVQEDATINVTDIIAAENLFPNDTSDLFAAGAISSLVKTG
jgi:hypothetical protein